MSLDALKEIDQQKEKILRNTQQFVKGLPANNVLLTGARGTGKSSLIKALLTKYAPHGLRVIEVEKQDLIDLPEIVELIAGRPESSSNSFMPRCRVSRKRSSSIRTTRSISALMAFSRSPSASLNSTFASSASPSAWRATT